MERTRTRAVTALVAVLAATSVLTGCAAGLDAQTAKPYSPGDGVLATSGDVRVLNALVVAADGSTTGLVSAGVANTGTSDDRLSGITSPQGAVALSGDTTIPAGGAISLGNGGSGGPTATVSGLTVKPGDEVVLRLMFSRAEPITVRTLVHPTDGYYATFTPSAVPSP